MASSSELRNKWFWETNLSERVLELNELTHILAIGTDRDGWCPRKRRRLRFILFMGTTKVLKPRDSDSFSHLVAGTASDQLFQPPHNSPDLVDVSKQHRIKVAIRGPHTPEFCPRFGKIHVITGLVQKHENRVMVRPSTDILAQLNVFLTQLATWQQLLARNMLP